MTNIAHKRSQKTLTVFISYTSSDEVLKDQLLRHLRALPIAKEINLWSEDQIAAGEDWLEKTREAMTDATIAIPLISADFLGSEFILNTHLPTLLERRESEGLIIFPIIARHCPWEQISWLTELSVRPKDRQPLWIEDRVRAEKELTAVASEVARIVEIDLLFNNAWEYHTKQDWANAQKGWQQVIEKKQSGYKGYNIQDLLSEASKHLQEQEILYEQGMDAYRIGEWTIARENLEQLEKINTIYSQQSIQPLLEDIDKRIKKLANALQKEALKAHQAKDWAKAEEAWLRLLNLGMKTYRRRKIGSWLKEAREERHRQEGPETPLPAPATQPTSPPTFSPLTHIPSLIFDKINQRPFLEKGERCQAGRLSIIPAWPHKAVSISVSGAGHNERNAYVTVSEAGQITVESWSPSASLIRTQVRRSDDDWPYKYHSWKFEPLNLKQSFQIEDGTGLFNSNMITAAWWIWHQATGRVEEKFLILVGKIQKD